MSDAQERLIEKLLDRPAHPPMTERDRQELVVLRAEVAELHKLATDWRVSSEAIGIRVRNRLAAFQHRPQDTAGGREGT